MPHSVKFPMILVGEKKNVEDFLIIKCQELHTWLESELSYLKNKIKSESQNRSWKQQLSVKCNGACLTFRRSLSNAFE